MKPIKNIKNKTLLVLALALSSQAIAATQQSYQSSEPAAVSLPMQDDVEQQRVTYIWATVDSTSSHISQSQQVQSDEYWQTVTGAELNKGFPLYVGSDALVRLAPMASYQSGARQISPAVNMDSISLSASAGSQPTVSLLADQEAMQTAGFDDGSVAVKVANHSDKPLTMRSESQIPGDAEYLLHVKEKSSTGLLQFAMPSQLDSQQQAITINANLGAKAIIPMTTQVSIITPAGEHIAAQLQHNKVTFDQQLSEYGARQGLYQVQIHTLGNVNGKLIKRSAKLPFALTAKTAAIEKVTVSDKLWVSLDVLESGRYNLTATLQGIDKNGKAHSLQTADVAEYFEQSRAMALPFELQNFSQYDRFELVNVKLTDQSRLMTLQVLPQLK